ncbi:MAG: hypothetical protein NZ602_11095 [Thermoguttaceae bacterium]|nr:hypothetical protein [Thermoguttaceae bacterium]MDW8036723.1 hypothetical protein [Thermoguttaceae bacterium]
MPNCTGPLRVQGRWGGVMVGMLLVPGRRPGVRWLTGLRSSEQLFRDLKTIWKATRPQVRSVWANLAAWHRTSSRQWCTHLWAAKETKEWLAHLPGPANKLPSR